MLRILNPTSYINVATGISISTVFLAREVSALACALEQMANERTDWEQRGISIAEECRKTYSAEAMAAGVIQAVDTEIRNSCAVP